MEETFGADTGKEKKAIEIAQQLYLQCTYAIFQEAKDAAAEYERI